MSNVNDTRDANGKLPAISFPGGYSIQYICGDGSVICAECANNFEPGEYPDAEPTKGFIYYEGPDSYCEDCNVVMPSEYGDPDEN